MKNFAAIALLFAVATTAVPIGKLSSTFPILAATTSFCYGKILTAFREQEWSRFCLRSKVGLEKSMAFLW
jgi:hypothetical protein